MSFLGMLQGSPGTLTGYTARSLGESIFTEADDLTQLQEQVRDAVLCHFDDEEARPKLIRLHFVREELIAV